MWEILTFGDVPYTRYASSEMYSLLQSGERLPVPNACKSNAYIVMLQCRV